MKGASASEGHQNLLVLFSERMETFYWSRECPELEGNISGFNFILETKQQPELYNLHLGKVSETNARDKLQSWNMTG